MFSLPFSNGRVEQIFSSLKLIKTTNRTSLRTTTLDDLLEINVEGPPLSEFSSANAIDLWWKSCRTTRRTNQSKRKPYRSRHHNDEAEVVAGDRQDSSYTSSDPDPENDLDLSQETSLPTVLDDWDKLFL